MKEQSTLSKVDVLADWKECSMCRFYFDCKYPGKAPWRICRDYADEGGIAD